MKLLDTILEAFTYNVKEIKRNDTEALQDFCDFYNESDQLSWTLTPQRLLGKVGSTGRLFALYHTDTLVGTIGLKETGVSADAKELGYIMIAEQHRSLKNVLMLYKPLQKYIKRTDLTFATTNKDNRAINKLMEFSNKFIRVMLIRSTFSTNQLYVWLSTESGDIEEATEALKQHFGSHILQIL